MKTPAPTSSSKSRAERLMAPGEDRTLCLVPHDPELEACSLRIEASSRRRWGNVDLLVEPREVDLPHDVLGLAGGQWSIQADAIDEGITLAHPDLRRDVSAGV